MRAPNNHREFGALRYIHLEEDFDFECGDLILSRFNKPMVETAYNYLVREESNRVVIKGECKFEQLIHSFITKFKKQTSIKIFEEFIDKQEKSTNINLIVEENFSRKIFSDEYFEIIRMMWKKADNDIENLSNIVNKMFPPANPSEYTVEKCVTFSSIHRSKGLTAKRTFILKPSTLLPKCGDYISQIQELNCVYVALTRAKEELYFALEAKIDGKFKRNISPEEEIDFFNDLKTKGEINAECDLQLKELEEAIANFKNNITIPEDSEFEFTFRSE